MTPPRSSRVLTAYMFYTPPKEYLLPPYAEVVASMDVEAPSDDIRRRRSLFDPKILEFLDLEADQCEDVLFGTKDT